MQIKEFKGINRLVVAYTGDINSQRGEALARLEECSDVIGHCGNIHLFLF